MRQRFTLEEFKDLVRAAHGDSITFENTVYKNMNSPVKLTCKKHGGYITKARSALMRCGGCPMCARESIRKARTKHGSLTHGGEHPRLYDIWTSMRGRCANKKDKLYGGKGVTVCREWEDYAVFREWAYANGYKDTLSIDRIDGNKGYCPSNCRWATREQQANNTCTNVRITDGERTYTFPELLQLSGINYAGMRKRIEQLNSRTISPAEMDWLIAGRRNTNRHLKTDDGIITDGTRRYHIQEMADIADVHYTTMVKRHRRYEHRQVLTVTEMDSLLLPKKGAEKNE